MEERRACWVVLPLFYFILVVLGREYPTSGNQVGHRERRNIADCSKTDVHINTSDRLQRLRKQMYYFEYDAFIITSGDEHQSEYVAEYDKRREFITGFTGSYGTAVVLKEGDAALWTDFRYYIQAEQELNCNWQLIREKEGKSLSVSEWLAGKLTKGARVAADARLISQLQWKKWAEELEKTGIHLISNSTNLVDIVWGVGERPVEFSPKIFIHGIEFAGKSWEEKIKDTREKLKEKKVDAMLVTSLTEIAWLLNLRGSDVPFVPVFKAFVTLTQNAVKLYVKKKKITAEINKHLNVTCPPAAPSCIKVEIADYQDIYKSASKDFKGLKVLMPESVSFAIYNNQKKENIKIEMTPTLEAMVVKNPIEIKGMENAMLKDSMALISFFAMLEAEVKQGRSWDELKAAKEVQKYRNEQRYYKGESFPAISAVGAHAAMPHYIPKNSTNTPIDKKHMYLLDSGGQYLDGTTDITRTFHFGDPNDFEKEAYTRVLIGVISLASLVFPEGTKDTQVDVLTHQALYNVGLDYGHGTGHGVGSYLSVHEYPPIIRLPTKDSQGFSFQPGMFFSIEPGYYQKDDFGIRLETIFTIVPINTKYHFENKTFYTFEPVVWIPFEKKMIKSELLTNAQVKWLDRYNEKCVTIVGQRLRQAQQQAGLKWLLDRSVPVSDWTRSSTTTIGGPMYTIIFFCLFCFHGQ